MTKVTSVSKLAWAVVIGIGVLILLSLVAGLVAPLLYGRGYGYGWGMMGPGMMGGFGFPFMGMGLGMLVFWALIIGGIVWLVQSLSRGTGSSSAHGGALLDLLKGRYARGEIAKEQFEGMKRDLNL
jgi:putative membrane protein